MVYEFASTSKISFAGAGISAIASSIDNLELRDFNISGVSSAGALAGMMTKSTVTNVLARELNNNDRTISASKGNAGGLIGSANGTTVTKSAAAVYVKGGSAAGGLIGSAASGNVTACYSGGHTYSGAPAYDSAADRPDPRNSKNTYPVRYYDADNKPMYNVTGTTVGGLIGSAGAATISNSYSTCSASGTTAGGFVGTGGNSITECYCTGLVYGTTVGAFSGSISTGSGADNTCKYFEIINERRNLDNAGNLTPGYNYLTAFPDGDGSVGKIDDTAANYQTFSGDPEKWNDAKPYDAGLKTYYQNKYNLKPVSTDEKDFVSTHYGDWPAPEEFIFN